MKALVYHGPNQKSWEEVPNPKIIDPTDVIVQVDTTTISSPQELVTAISGHKKGDKVTVTYTRDGDTKTTEVTLGDRSDAPTFTSSRGTSRP